MSENKDGWPDFNLFPKIKRAGEFLSRFVLGPHLFSDVSDHFQHPLDDTFERPAYHEPTDGEAGE